MKLTLSVLIALLLLTRRHARNSRQARQRILKPIRGQLRALLDVRGRAYSYPPVAAPQYGSSVLRQTSPLLAEMFNALRSSRRSLA